MSYKIAIASSDGKFVNQHFGTTQQFLVVELEDDGSYKFLETRKNKPACGVEGHDSSIYDSIDLISDCDGVLVSQIGPGASQYLLNNGIQPLIMPGFIDEILDKISKNF